MATLLHRLGRACAAHRRLVVLVWVLVLVGAATSAATLSGATTSSFSVPGTESARALDTLEAEFPGAGAAGAYANVVFQAPAGEQLTSGQDARAVAAAVEGLGDVPGVGSVTDPLDPQSPTVSRDQTIALSRVSFGGERGELVPEASLEALRGVAAQARDAGLRVELGGTAFQDVPEVLGPGEVVGVVVAFAVLLLTYGSLVAAGANLVTALVGVGIGIGGITALTGFVDLQSTTPILAVMLGLAVGIDYALFIFARFRSELRDVHDVPEAVARSVGTAGSAVVVAGLTVVIALLGLSVVGIPFLTEMGIAAASTVVIAVLVALTLVPALLRGLGRRMLGRQERSGAPRRSRHAGGRRTVLTRWSGVVAGHPVRALVGALVVLLVVAAPATVLRTSLGDDGTAAPDSSARQAYDLVAQGFGPGVNGPLVVLVQDQDGGQDGGQEAAQAGARVAQLVGGLPDVATVTPPQPSADGAAALVTVVPTSGPTDEATADLVRDIRAAVTGVSGAEVSVTGSTAVGIDVDAQLAQALPQYLLLVVGLALVLLLLVFRSLLVPVTATLGFLLSIAAGLGATTAVYQWGWLSGLFGVAQPAPVFSLLPIISVGILFGLAMDYQVFLVARIHEAHAKGESPRDAVVLGFRRAAPVVVAAATIMAAVFAGFAGSSDPVVGSIALTLTVGVVADAFLVRMVLMPAVLTLSGRAAWWLPGWLARALPHVDVEGRALEGQQVARPSGEGTGVVAGAEA